MLKRIKKILLASLFEEVKNVTSSAIDEISKEKRIAILNKSIKKNRKIYGILSSLIVVFYVLIVLVINNFSPTSFFYLMSGGINLGFVVLCFFDLIAISFTVCLVCELSNIKKIANITNDPFDDLTNDSFEYIFTYIFAIFLMGLIVIGIYSNIFAAYIEYILLMFSLLYSYLYLRRLDKKRIKEV